MAASKFHKKVFDEGTGVKLDILRKYFRSWLPVFFQARNKYWDKIFIYDFFAGQGKDMDGNLGSPLIILSELQNHCQAIFESKINCKVTFNELDTRNIKVLENHIASFINECRNVNDCPCANKPKCVFDLVIENNDFNTFFQRIYPIMEKSTNYPRFMFLDQFGIKQITEDIFSKLISLKRTDFLFFISSSFALRFIEIPEFKTYIKLTRQKFDAKKPYHCHRVIFEYYKQLIPEDQEVYLAPFSIKKGSNIYGLIFGTHHLLGIEKFLTVCWNMNKNTGDSNFDIDYDKISPEEPKLFPSFNIPNKLSLFKNELRTRILNKEIKTLGGAYVFGFEMGCIPKHVNEELELLKKEKKVKKDLPLVTRNIHKLLAKDISLT